MKAHNSMQYNIGGLFSTILFTDLLFSAYVGIHQVRILVFNNITKRTEAIVRNWKYVESWIRNISDF